MKRAVITCVRLAAAIAALAAAGPAAAQDTHSENVRLIAEPTLGRLSDMAFRGNLAIVGHMGVKEGFGEGEDDGFSVVDISEPSAPRTLSRLRCSSAGWDVSVWGDLVFLSVDGFRPSAGPGCDSPPGPGFSGIKIVSIADPANPRWVASVDTSCTGSHNHTLVPEPDRGRIVVYASTLSDRVLEGQACDPVIEVPLADPARARIVSNLPGGDVQACHDVTVFVPRRLAIGSCVGEMRVFDISDAAAPKLLSVTRNPFNEFHHSSAFSNDGLRVAIGEESVNFDRACPGGTRAPVGALWFYDLTDPTAPVLQGYHQIERGLDEAVPLIGCSAHNFSTVPLSGDRDVLSVGWYHGGFSLVDWTDPLLAEQVAWFRADADDGERTSSYWAAYWYRGHVYASNEWATERQTLDILRVEDPSLSGAVSLPHFNPQSQEGLNPFSPALPTPSGTADNRAGARPGARPPATRARGCAPFRLTIRGARRILKAQLLLGRRVVRRLAVRRQGIVVSGRGDRVRVRYRDSRGRTRVKLRRVRCAG